MTKRRAFVYWLGFAKKERLTERCEKMNELVTNMWFKQKVFLSMKLAIMEQQAQKEIDKFDQWKRWCENNRK